MWPEYRSLVAQWIVAIFRGFASVLKQRGEENFSLELHRVDVVVHWCTFGIDRTSAIKLLFFLLHPHVRGEKPHIFLPLFLPARPC